MSTRALHWLDRAYRRLGRSGPYYTEGWGDAALLDRIAAGWAFDSSARRLDLAWGPERTEGGVRVQDATFHHPVEHLPADVRQGHLRLLRPVDERPDTPSLLVLAASGEEGYAMRTRLVRPLVREGVRVLLLENPYYGRRRPLGQKAASLRRVSDQLSMNIATVEEARALLVHLREHFSGPIAVGGYSMGGYMAAITACHTAFPVGVAALAAGRSAVPVYTTESISLAIAWRALGHGARERLAHLFAQLDLGNHPRPRCPQAAIVVAARGDAYVPFAQSQALVALWPGSELRAIDGGHVSTLLFRGDVLRQAVRDALARVDAAERQATPSPASELP